MLLADAVVELFGQCSPYQLPHMLHPDRGVPQNDSAGLHRREHGEQQWDVGGPVFLVLALAALGTVRIQWRQQQQSQSKQTAHHLLTTCATVAAADMRVTGINQHPEVVLALVGRNDQLHFHLLMPSCMSELHCLHHKLSFSAKFPGHNPISISLQDINASACGMNLWWYLCNHHTPDLHGQILERETAP
jgi:hypothetical protein